MRRVETRLRGQDPVVDLALPARHAALDPPQLELLLRERRPSPASSSSRAPGQSVAKPVAAAEDEHRLVLLRLDIALARRRIRVRCARTDLAQPRLGQEEEVVVIATQDDERRDHTCLRGEEKRRARLADASDSTSFETIRCR